MTPRRAGLFDRDAVQHRQLRDELAPDPDREQLRGRVLEAGDLVEHVVIEALDERIDGAFEIGEVDYPT